MRLIEQSIIMDNKKLYTLAAVLILTALAVFSYKILVLKYPLQPQAQSDIWSLKWLRHEYT